LCPYEASGTRSPPLSTATTRRRDTSLDDDTMIRRRRLDSLRWSLRACAAQPVVVVSESAVGRPALARVESSPVRQGRTLSVGKGTALAQLIDGRRHRWSASCADCTQSGPSHPLPCQRGRPRGDSDQSRPHSAPTTPDITIVKAGADSISHASGLV